MRVSATHIVLEHSGRMNDQELKLRKVYELSDGEYIMETEDRTLASLTPEIFAEWEENYKILMNIKNK